MKITHKFAVIGSPIGHSLSPEIHLPVLRRFFEAVEYNKVEVKKGELPEWMKRVRTEPIRGFNITMPHKTDVIPLLDGLEGDALVYGSVNTVVNRQGRLTGYNTDGEGFRLSLLQTGRGLEEANLLILGAGGVARTLVLKAISEGASQITILARNPEKAEALLREAKKTIRETGIAFGESMGANNKINKDMRMEYGSLDEAAERAKGADIFINATPLGMEGMESDFADLAFLKELKREALVYDLIYYPGETRLLGAASALGLSTQNGLGMLIYQGMLADRLFADEDFDFDEMYYMVKVQLEGKVDRL